MNLKRLLKTAPEFLLHLFAFGTIFYLLKPIFQWYLSKTPIIGVDFYNSVTYVTYLKNHFAFQFNGFKDIWFAGYPLLDDFISIQFFPMIVATNFFGTIKGIQIYVLISLFLLCAFSYLLFAVLSKSKALALLLTLFVIYSINIYGSAMWGGSLPYFTSQFFVPLVLLLLVKYNETRDVRYFLTSIIAGGLGFLGHPMPMFAFGLPAASLVIFFGQLDYDRKLFKNITSAVKKIFLFSIGVLAVAFPVSYAQVFSFILGIFTAGPQTIIKRFYSGGGVSVTGDPVSQAGANQAAEFYASLAKFVFTETSLLIFWLAVAGVALFLIAFALKRKKDMVLRVAPFALIAAYGALHPIANAHGIAIIPQGWYRAFWPFPIFLAAFAAASWGEALRLFQEKIKFSKNYFHFVATNAPNLLIAVAALYFGYIFINAQTPKFLAEMDKKVEFSSAHPQALSILTSEDDRKNLKKSLIPSFINGDDKNKRLYESDALVNIWWNSLYEMPMVRGYVDPPIATSQRGGFFWLDIAIGNDSLVRDFKVDEQTALNNALFLIDWYGVYFYEGGRLAISTSLPPSSYLLKNNVFEKEEQTTVYGAVLKWETQSGKPELKMDIPQYLKFYKVKDENTSPILAPTNSPAILIISDLPGYEDFLRVLAFSNINSQYLIPVNGGKYIDDMSASDLKNFDAVILNNYDYHDKGKAFGMLAKYVQNGGKVFIDTGAESKESNSKNLPEIFPFKSSERKGLGKSLNLEASPDKITDGVGLDQFGPLVFNGDEWKLTIPSEIEGDSTVLLKHNGNPILIKQSLGKGQVVWSGMNLLYHFSQYKSAEEGKLSTNIIKSFVPVQKNAVPKSDAVWSKSEKVSLASSGGARGVLCKEAGYKGGNIKAEGGKNLKIYHAGPTYPGFMYASVNQSEPFTVKFSYGGELKSYLIFGLSVVVTIILLDKIIFGGIILNSRLNIFSKKASKKVNVWWEKEEE